MLRPPLKASLPASTPTPTAPPALVSPACPQSCVELEPSTVVGPALAEVDNNRSSPLPGVFRGRPGRPGRPGHALQWVLSALSVACASTCLPVSRHGLKSAAASGPLRCHSFASGAWKSVSRDRCRKARKRARAMARRACLQDRKCFPCCGRRRRWFIKESA